MVDVTISARARDREAAAPAPLERPEFEIVPRRGLMIVAVLMVLLIAAIAADQLWPLMFLHVAGGAAWTIVDLFLGLVLGPIIGRMSIPARVELTTRLMPKMVLIMPAVVTLTLAAGWQLGVKEGTVLTSYPHHGWVVASFIVVGVMSVIALGLLEPANIAVLVELKKRRPNPLVIERLMKRFIYAAGVLGVMQVASRRSLGWRGGGRAGRPDDRRRCGRGARIEPEAPVAQLDRASVYGTEGREFESLRARWRSPVLQAGLDVSRTAASRDSPCGR